MPFAASLRGSGAISLSDLNLSLVQSESGPLTGGEPSRSDSGLVLRAGSSLWVDLKNDAEELRATVQPLPGTRGAPVRCRFATANDIREVEVSADSAPAQIDLPLGGQELLVIEALGTQKEEGIRIHITSSSISLRSLRPEAIGGAAPIQWTSDQWNIHIDGRSGGITHLSHPKDAFGMEWIRQAAPWGTGWARIEGKTTPWNRPVRVTKTSATAMEAMYEMPRLQIRVNRELQTDGTIKESYTFKNTGAIPLMFSDDALGIRLPLVDNYPGAEICLPARCHVHLWPGGSSSYVNALRMGGNAPNLGLVLTEGSLSSYSIYDRIAHSNDRGQFVIHPSAMTLAPSESRTVSWVIFWHEGWADFFRRAAQYESFIRLQADRYSVTQGDPIHVVAEARHSLEGAELRVNGQKVAARLQGNRLEANVPTRELGEQRVELDWGTQKSVLRAFVTPPPLDLIAARVKFIVEHQQCHAPGEALDGAYLIYDNETNAQVYEANVSDHNAGRERTAMGVLAALYLPHCRDAKLHDEIAQSVLAYEKFFERELQNEAGTVFNDVGRSGKARMYNYPWAIHFHVAMYEAFGKIEYLRRALDACRVYYGNNGDRFYCIGMPIQPLLRALEKAGWDNERKEVIAAFRKHALRLREIGSSYPKHEVNYEQSIVAPAAQLMLDMYLTTREPLFLEGARKQLELLELFNGFQPDYHLHDIAIRHWDDYWFGKRRVYADTFPHYWSTITADVFALYAEATGDKNYRERAEGVWANNLCSFTPEGRASCAYVYPATANGTPGQFFDPWANDQDWALVSWLRGHENQ